MDETDSDGTLVNQDTSQAQDCNFLDYAELKFGNSATLHC